MRMLSLMILGLCAGSLLTGCVGSRTVVDLENARSANGMINVTTGDGEFEDYTATGVYSAREIGISVGIFNWEFMELYPAVEYNELAVMMAREAKNDGANAMIGVVPALDFFQGFILGPSIEVISGTGIKVK
jgi:hypothetical protein